MSLCLAVGAAIGGIGGLYGASWLAKTFGPDPPKKKRSGFTLVELLVTMVIIAIIAGIVLVAAQAAQNAANRANTQALIAKLHGQLMVRLESYRTRRIPVTGSLTIVNNPSGLPTPGSLNALQNAAVRLNVIREMMRMEMPDRYSDLVVGNKPNVQNLPLTAPIAAYAFRYDVNNGIWSTDLFPPPINTPKTMQATATALSMQARAETPLPQSPQITPENEDAECLYMILNTGLSDSSVGNELINPSNIGDTDADGMPEYIDAWGRPIHFLRWAPGFISDMQPQDGAGHHDPFDPLKIQSGAYNLVPLIWSSGQDGISDIKMPAPDAKGFAVSSALPANLLPWTYTFPMGAFPQFTMNIYNPYADMTIGGPADTNNDGDSTGWMDNLTNHLIGQ